MNAKISGTTNRCFSLSKSILKTLKLSPREILGKKKKKQGEEQYAKYYIGSQCVRCVCAPPCTCRHAHAHV